MLPHLLSLLIFQHWKTAYMAFGSTCTASGALLAMNGW
jgi:hypothetical protein